MNDSETSNSKARRNEDDASLVAHAAEIIRRGGVVAFPTETVYGLGASALDATAVARVFEIKTRPRFDPLIVHVSGVPMMENVVEVAPEVARRLVEYFWPGPLTIVLPKRPAIPDIVTAGLPTVAVRMPDHPLALALIREAGVPIAAPSANRFGAVSPTTAEHVRESLGDEVDFILDGGPCRIGMESTVLSFADSGDAPSLLRPGGLGLEELSRALGRPPRIRLAKTSSSSSGAETEQRGRESPGMLTSHYATRTRLALATMHAADEWRDKLAGLRIGLLCYTSSNEMERFMSSPPAAVEILAPDGDLRVAAANLFAAMRRLDARGLDLILAEEVPNEGLGYAINDRLRRAAAATAPAAD